MSDITRKMASVRRIDAVNPIPGADAIEVCTVGGWKVVAKKGEFKEGDIAVYCEIDSWIPTELAPFLSKGKEPRDYNGVKGERLRTIRLRGQISQGLLIPAMGTFSEGTDMTEILNIQKWEAPIPAQLAGVVRGNFPSFLRKTDQERIQNLTKEFEVWKNDTELWEVSEKLDGSSMTVYFNNGDFGVCSRNLDLKRDENNSFWKTAIALNLEEILRALGINFALQGELVGEGIQGNPYGLTGQHFYMFNLFDIDKQEYTSPSACRAFANNVDINHVPVIARFRNLIPTDTVESMLLAAEGFSALNSKTEREGLVFKKESEDVSFKCISNLFLMGEKA
jgi:RNA ligase (TIGR02306 family)